MKALGGAITPAGLVALLLLSTGCTCFIACDPYLHVSGVVRAADGQPIEGASVSAYPDSTVTSEEGCFRLAGGEYPKEVAIEVRKSGYKPYEAKRGFGLYRIEVMLEVATSAQESTARWITLKPEEARRQSRCEG